MKRSTAIRHLFITGGALWLFPQCVGKSKNGAQDLLQAAEKDLLADISETIIPSATAPGAASLGIPHFIHKMIADCRGPAFQKDFIVGLNGFETAIRQRLGEKWTTLSQEQKERTLASLLSDKKTEPMLRNCIQTIRDLTIQGYKNSEYYLTKVQEYKMVPGHFYGCVRLKNKTV